MAPEQSHVSVVAFGRRGHGTTLRNTENENVYDYTRLDNPDSEWKAFSHFVRYQRDMAAGARGDLCVAGSSCRGWTTAFANDKQKADFAERLWIYDQHGFERVCGCLYPEEVCALISSTQRLRAAYSCQAATATSRFSGPPAREKLFRIVFAGYTRQQWNFEHDRDVAFGALPDQEIGKAFMATNMWRRHMRRRRGNISPHRNRGYGHSSRPRYDGQAFRHRGYGR